MVTAPGSRRRLRETPRGRSPRGGSSQPAPAKPAAAMGSPQRPPLAHVFKGTFVHSSASAPMEILHGHLLGVDDNGTVSGGRGRRRGAGGGGDAGRCLPVRSAGAVVPARPARPQGPSGAVKMTLFGPESASGDGEGAGSASLWGESGKFSHSCPSGQAPRRRDFAPAGAGGRRDGASRRHESAVGVNLQSALEVC